MSRLTRTAAPLPATRIRITRMGSRSIQTRRIMWRRQRPSALDSRQIAIMGSMRVTESAVIVPDSGAMEPGIGVMDCKVENRGAIKRPEPESAAADAIAQRLPRSSHRSSAVAIF